MRHLKGLAGCAAALAVAAALVAPSPAVAGRPRSLELTDCYEHTAFFPIPKDQGRTHVPAGFEPASAPADNENLTNFYVTSFVCGDPEKPRLELVLTHLVVDSPEELAAASAHYVVDMGIEGPAAAGFRKLTCAPAEGAAIDVTNETVRSPLGPQAGAAVTSVAADFASATFAVSAERTSGWGSEDVRWFFGDGARFFDSSSALLFWGIGSSTVAFQEPYLDLPPAASGASKHAVADITFSVARPCRYPA